MSQQFKPGDAVAAHGLPGKVLSVVSGIDKTWYEVEYMLPDGSVQRVARVAPHDLTPV